LISVGNDIVDLGSPLAGGKSRDTRFLRRVFTAEERRSIARSPSPDRALWSLWAAKETAYKAIMKGSPTVSSAPRRYPVVLEPQAGGVPVEGFVETPRHPVRVRVFHHGDHLHCIGSAGHAGDIPPLDSGIARSCGKKNALYGQADRRASRHVRLLAAVAIAQSLGCRREEIAITSRRLAGEARCPAVHIRNRRQPMDISFSHDGRYVAFAFCPDTRSPLDETLAAPTGKE